MFSRSWPNYANGTLTSEVKLINCLPIFIPDVFVLPRLSSKAVLNEAEDRGRFRMFSEAESDVN